MLPEKRKCYWCGKLTEDFVDTGNGVICKDCANWKTNIRIKKANNLRKVTAKYLEKLKYCHSCGKPYHPKSPCQVYCSYECKSVEQVKKQKRKKLNELKKRQNFITTNTINHVYPEFYLSNKLQEIAQNLLSSKDTIANKGGVDLWKIILKLKEGGK